MNIQIQTDTPPTALFVQPIETAFFDKKADQLLEKWGIQHSLKIQAFRFDRKFQDSQNFFLELINHPNFKGVFTSLPIESTGATAVKYQKLKCSLVTTDLFQKLQGQVVFKDSIKKTYEDIFEQIVINDVLRQCLLKQQSQFYSIFNQNDRNQLLFRLFQLFVLGGQMCQYQDNLSPYVQAVKQLYKKLVQVRLDPESKQIYSESKFFEIKSITKGYKKGYNPQQVLYIVVSQSTRTLHVIHNDWIKVW